MLSTDSALIEAAQRLRYDVFAATPGFALPAADDRRDVDRFDEYCDHLLVRDDDTGELVGCYRMLPPAGPSPREASIPLPSSTWVPSTRCGRRWWKWVAPRCVTGTAMVRWCC
ncbi:acetyltransferase domain protein [Mycobacterium ulcerans str. Harvey]|uniref:Acetyltransferase domain protein n=1 Tax=Mycobacterium ulcerans str. Harvey TaxID=1299332 RepID=A0ABN0R0M3_MYCUL|nr:acetyltransferase domain protein [Mycobacterium ulcerans str. Harvey]